ncbi:MAG: hypothetical protein KKH88_04710 [Nanoarchaeota archaeon]|nr:hypothetical protein [Nanoarchaeota archaeon]MBU1444943.1 hypothetical protein [Nanoarchaeota archaeon]MBU2475697.1 hypothetical protein [Nanoarchaeota archaeon]MBU3941201.1 hypothetical protein [Nanoarchaeota archaeon]
MTHFINKKHFEYQRYFKIINDSYRKLKGNLLILVPDLILLFVTLILSIVFLWFNGLMPGGLVDPSVLFQTDEGVETFKNILLKFLGKTDFASFLISLAAFFVARFFIGAGLLTIKYNMIKRTIEGKKITNFKKELLMVALDPKKFINVIKMNFLVYVLMLFLAVFLSIITLLFLDVNTAGFLFMVFAISISVFLVKVIFFFRYAVMFLDNLSAWSSIKDAFYYFKQHPVFVILVWLFLFIAIFLISLVLSTLTFGVSQLVFLVAGTVTSLFILNLLKNLISIFLGLLGDIFIFNIYSRKKI